MDYKPNFGADAEDMKKGYCNGDYKPDQEQLDESPTNSQWRDLDDGGFLGRPKGQER
jgi:hypothetical protein